MKLQAFINHGRYVVRCPKCENFHQVTDRTLVCAACWTDMRAQKIVLDRFGAMVPAPHVELIMETIQKAREAGEEYEIEYPDPQIMKSLRSRPIENMNWMPGESLAFIQQENEDHGLEGA